MRKFSVDGFLPCGFGSLLCVKCLRGSSPPTSHHLSYTMHLTPFFSHRSSHTTHLTLLTLHHSSQTTHLTPLILIHSSLTTISHHLSQSSYTTHLTTPISHKKKPSDAGWVLLGCLLAVFCFVLRRFFLCFRMFLPKVACHGVDVSVNTGSSAPALGYSSLC